MLLYAVCRDLQGSFGWFLGRSHGLIGFTRVQRVYTGS